ncbi:TlpA disulfide reductase family protein [Porticoccaceae bacterium LTM1]|nr:TlpA disulfide reductase family protein [Porticoccaceae bacterium LTM1]
MIKILVAFFSLFFATVTFGNETSATAEMDPTSLTAYNQIKEYRAYIDSKAPKMKGADQLYKDTWKLMQPKIKKWVSDYAGKVDLKQHQWLEWWAISVCKKTLENPAKMYTESFEKYLVSYKGKFPGAHRRGADKKLTRTTTNFVGYAFKDLSEKKELNRFNTYMEYFFNEPKIPFDLYHNFLKEIAKTESSENWNVEDLKSQIIAAAEKYGNFTPRLIDTLKNHTNDSNNTAIGVQGKSFVPFSGPDLNGNTISVTDFRGKVLLIDFWATWCAPCMKKVPELVGLYDKYRDQGLEILGVSGDYEGEIENVASTVEDKGMEWPQIYDNGMQEAQTLNSVRAIPYIILLDKGGNARYFNLHGEDLEKKIEELLAETEDQAKQQQSASENRSTSKRRF